MSRGSLVWFASLVLVLAAPVARAQSAPPLDGIWMFDAAHSDDPAKVMQASRASRGGGEGGEAGGGGGYGRRGGGMRGGGMGGGGGRWNRGGEGGGEAGGAGGDAQDAQRAAARSAMDRVFRPAKKLVIEMATDEVRLSEDEATPRPFAIADSLRAHGHEAVAGDGQARWNGAVLETTQVLGPRGSLVEDYAVSSDGRTLTITAHREGGRQGGSAPTFKRVYTRYEGE